MQESYANSSASHVNVPEHRITLLTASPLFADQRGAKRSFPKENREAAMMALTSSSSKPVAGIL